ncbi:unnamed protein product, partial [Durusdinium trenchii]
GASAEKVSASLEASQMVVVALLDLASYAPLKSQRLEVFLFIMRMQGVMNNDRIDGLLLFWRKHSMPKFLNHDALAADLFNLNHTTGTGILASWKETLTNSEALLQLLVGRMEQDWLALAVKSRKPWNVKDCDSWVGVGLGPYRSNKLDNKFALRHADADLTSILENSVPPLDISKVSIFATHLSKYHAEGKLDWKYLSDRFERGKREIAKLMENKHKLVHFNSLTLAHPVIVNLQAAMGTAGLTILVMDATLWPSRALTIDEAVTLCQSVCSGNPSTLAWIMLPQYYTSSSKHSVLKNRRLLEDKLLGCMDVYEVSLNYADAQHSGDKRKKSQQCIAALCGHTTNAAFSKSKALLGSIEGIERTRVTDLQNPDPEHSLAPHWRVQQRGIPACQAIIEQLLQGMGASHGSPLLICDLLPSRFGEWSQAAWEMQLEFLRGSSAWDVRFAACYHTDHAADLNSAKELITGKAMHSWWDKSPEAGSKSRAAVPFSEPLPELECLTLNDGEVKTFFSNMLTF